MKELRWLREEPISPAFLFFIMCFVLLFSGSTRYKNYVQYELW